MKNKKVAQEVEYKISPDLYIIRSINYIKFMVSGCRRKRPGRSMVEQLPHKQRLPRPSGFESQSGRRQFL